jgi:hypothetical protein
VGGLPEILTEVCFHAFFVFLEIAVTADFEGEVGEGQTAGIDVVDFEVLLET